MVCLARAAFSIVIVARDVKPVGSILWERLRIVRKTPAHVLLRTGILARVNMNTAA